MSRDMWQFLSAYIMNFIFAGSWQSTKLTHRRAAVPYPSLAVNFQFPFRHAVDRFDTDRDRFREAEPISRSSGSGQHLEQQRTRDKSGLSANDPKRTLIRVTPTRAALLDGSLCKISAGQAGRTGAAAMAATPDSFP